MSEDGQFLDIIAMLLDQIKRLERKKADAAEVFDKLIEEHKAQMSMTLAAAGRRH